MGSVGFITGLQFCITSMALSSKCECKVVPGMIFCVSSGFCYVSVPKWAVWVCDTVIVPLDETECVVPTDGVKGMDDILYELGDEFPDEGASSAPMPPMPGQSGQPAAQTTNASNQRVCALPPQPVRKDQKTAVANKPSQLPKEQRIP